MALDTDADTILVNAHRPTDPDIQAAARREVIRRGASDCLGALGLEVES